MSEPGRITVLCFAGVRDLLGTSRFELEFAEPLRCEGLWGMLLERFPALAPHRESVRLAVNGRYAEPETQVRPGDEVAIIPPVAGG